MTEKSMLVDGDMLFGLVKQPVDDLYDVCEADEIYVTAGEKGLEDEEGSPRKRRLSKRGAETSSQTNRRS